MRRDNNIIICTLIQITKKGICKAHNIHVTVPSSFHLGAQPIYIFVESIDTVLDLEFKLHTKYCY